MSDLSRVEQLLMNALGEDIYEVTPKSRVEILLAQLNELIEGLNTSVDPETIASIVTAWLAENIHDGAAVDSSLSVAGAAAESKKVGDELSDLKEGLIQISGNAEIPLAGANKYIDLSGTSVTMDDGVPQFSIGTSAYSVSMMQCSEGDVFTISGVGGSATRLWGFVKADGTIITRSVPSTSATLLQIIAPEDAAWIITHTNDGRKSYRGELARTSIDNVENHLDLSSMLLWEKGSISTVDGTDTTSSTRIRSNSLPYDANGVIFLSNSIKVSLRGYDSNGDFVYASGSWRTNGFYLKDNLPSGIATYRIVGAYGDDATISDVGDVSDNISVRSYGYMSNLYASVFEHENRLNAIDKITILEFSLKWEIGSIGSNNGIDGISTTRVRSDSIKYDRSISVSIGSGIKYSFRYYDSNGLYLFGSPSWKTTGGNLAELVAGENRSDVNISTFRIVGAYDDDATITDASDIGDNITLTKTWNLRDAYEAVNNIHVDSIEINKTGLGNCAIRCAKEQSYVDGTPPVIEWYLLEEPNTGKMYYSKDLMSKSLLLTFPYDTYKYSFGILQNGDVIACLDPDSITTDDKSDSNRVNPYVFLASEQWEICHEVDFGSSLKPCGWASNQGFKVLANGEACWCEYTRQTTYTANVWKLSGDPLDSSNWVVTKSFVVTSIDNSTLFKHCHMIMQDFFTGVCYLTTGDDNIGSMMFASTDNCDTWTQLVSPDSDGQTNQYGYINGSEKYCRMAMMAFTETYIYWATDSNNASIHYLYKCERDENGILDYSTVESVVQIPSDYGESTYGIALIPELNAIMLLDRCDVHSHELPLKLVTLADNQIAVIGKLYGVPVTEDGVNVGFRCRFSEWYPINGLIHVGFDLRTNRHNHAVNHNRGFGNTGTLTTGGGDRNINNLAMQIYRDGDTYGFKMQTFYI